MKRIKPLLIGLFIGSAVTFAVSGLAEQKTVSAVFDSSIQFIVNGMSQTIPKSEGGGVLFYQDRIYIPIRATSNMLNQEINWIPSERTVVITDRRPSPTTQTMVTTETTTQETTQATTEMTTAETTTAQSYKDMPLKYENTDFELELKQIYVYKNTSSMSIYFKNESDKPIHLEPWKIKVTADDVVYTMQDTPPETYQDLERDQEIEFTAQFIEGLPKSVDKVKVEIPVVYNGVNPETKVITFYTNVKYQD